MLTLLLQSGTLSNAADLRRRSYYLLFTTELLHGFNRCFQFRRASRRDRRS